jgi:hypothetical protein
MQIWQDRCYRRAEIASFTPSPINRAVAGIDFPRREPVDRDQCPEGEPDGGRSSTQQCTTPAWPTTASPDNRNRLRGDCSVRPVALSTPDPISHMATEPPAGFRRDGSGRNHSRKTGAGAGRGDPPPPRLAANRFAQLIGQGSSANKLQFYPEIPSGSPSC